MPLATAKTICYSWIFISADFPTRPRHSHLVPCTQTPSSRVSPPSLRAAPPASTRPRTRLDYPGISTLMTPERSSRDWTRSFVRSEGPKLRELISTLPLLPPPLSPTTLYVLLTGVARQRVCVLINRADLPSYLPAFAPHFLASSSTYKNASRSRVRSKTIFNS